MVTEARTLPVFCYCSSHQTGPKCAGERGAPHGHGAAGRPANGGRRGLAQPVYFTLESRAGRLHQKVRVSQLSTGKWCSCTRAVLQIGGSLSRMGRAKLTAGACVRCTERCQCFLQRGMQGGVDRLHWMPATRSFRSSFRGCHDRVLFFPRIILLTLPP